jgi:hypothetical protein
MLTNDEIFARPHKHASPGGLRDSQPGNYPTEWLGGILSTSLKGDQTPARGQSRMGAPTGFRRGTAPGRRVVGLRLSTGSSKSAPMTASPTVDNRDKQHVHALDSLLLTNHS